MENNPDVLAMVAASAALTISGVPFMGPIGAARVGYVDGEYVLNPPSTDAADSKLDLVMAGTADAVLMVESEAKELSEDVMLGAVMFGHDGFQQVIEAIIKLAELAAKEPRDFQPPDHSALEKPTMLGVAEADLRAAYKITEKARALRRGRCRQGQGQGALRCPKVEAGDRLDEAAVGEVFKNLAGQDRALEHPRHRHAASTAAT